MKREQQRSPLKVPAWRPRLAAAIRECTDAGFCEHVWLGVFRGGVVTLHVDDPSLVGALRMQWHGLLVRRLASRLPDLGILDVKFRYVEAPAGALPRVDPAKVDALAERATGRHRVGQRGVWD